MNAGEGLIITNLIESYEYIKIWLVPEYKGEVNDRSALMTAIRRRALPGCSGVWVMVVRYICKYKREHETHQGLTTHNQLLGSIEMKF